MEWLSNFRMHVAGWIIGDRSAFFASRRDLSRMRDNQFLDVPDEVLGKMFKHFWAVVTRTIADQGEREGMGFKAKMRSACVMFLVSEMDRTGGDSGTYSVRGSIDGGRTSGEWAVLVERKPFEGVGDRKVFDKQGKIIELTVTTDNPGYEEWRAENEARRAAAQAIEARRDKTAGLGPQDDSAVPAGNGPESHHHSQPEG